MDTCLHPIATTPSHVAIILCLLQTFASFFCTSAFLCFPAEQPVWEVMSPGVLWSLQTSLISGCPAPQGPAPSGLLSVSMTSRWILSFFLLHYTLLQSLCFPAKTSLKSFRDHWIPAALYFAWSTPSPWTAWLVSSHLGHSPSKRPNFFITRLFFSPTQK